MGWRLKWVGDCQKPYSPLEVPEYLKDRGVERARQTFSRTEVSGTFLNESRKTMLDTVKRVSRKYDIPLDKIKIKKVIVSNGKASAQFIRTRKQEVLLNDRRRKLMVLAMFNENGKIPIKVSRELRRLLEQLHAFSVTCRMIKEEKQTILCSSNRPITNSLKV